MFLPASLFLFSSQIAGVLAQTSSASWLYPVPPGLIINYIDTIVLQWDSNYATAYLRMWCQNISDPVNNDVVQGSNFQVTPSGEYSYILSQDHPSQTSFPVACHAQLATVENGGGGLDSPVGVTFASIIDTIPKTFSLGTTTSASTPMTTSSSSASLVTSLSSNTLSPSTLPVSLLPSNTAPTSPNNASPSGISDRAKAGIGIAATAVAIGILAALVWLSWRLRRARRNLEVYEIPQLGVNSERYEMMVPPSQYELEATPMIYELPHGTPYIKIAKRPSTIVEMAA